MVAREKSIGEEQRSTKTWPSPCQSNSTRESADIGRQVLEVVEAKASELACCKLTLEVMGQPRLAKIKRISSGCGRREFCCKRVEYQVVASVHSWSIVTSGRMG